MRLVQKLGQVNGGLGLAVPEPFPFGAGEAYSGKFRQCSSWLLSSLVEPGA